jgi:hypothetical protein
MADPDLLGLFIRPLERLGIRYMVSGSVAAMLFGEPRMTLDVDVIVFLDDAAVERLPSGFPPEEFYLPPADVMRLEAARERRGHFNVIHARSGLKADVYCANQDPLHRWAIERVRRVPVEGSSVAVAPPEYVILRKLEYFREGGSEKHVRDVRAMLAQTGDQIDRQALREWIERLGLASTWRAVGDE